MMIQGLKLNETKPEKKENTFILTILKGRFLSTENRSTGSQTYPIHSRLLYPFSILASLWIISILLREIFQPYQNNIWGSRIDIMQNDVTLWQCIFKVCF